MRVAWAIAGMLVAGCGAPATVGREQPPVAHDEPTSGSGPIVASAGAINRPASTTSGSATSASTTTTPFVPTPPPPADQGELISIVPGFHPDPIVRRGQGGGPVSATSMGPDCRGYVSRQPLYVLKVDRPMPLLRLLVSMQGDATLVVELADGRVLCNDDREGLNPIVEGPFPPGRHRVFVGTYGRSGVGRPFAFAVTTQPSLTTHAIESLPPTP